MEDRLQKPSDGEAVASSIVELSCKSEQTRAPAWLRRLRAAQAQEQSRQQ